MNMTGKDSFVAAIFLTRLCHLPRACMKPMFVKICLTTYSWSLEDFPSGDSILIDIIEFETKHKADFALEPKLIWKGKYVCQTIFHWAQIHGKPCGKNLPDSEAVNCFGIGRVFPNQRPGVGKNLPDSEAVNCFGIGQVFPNQRRGWRVRRRIGDGPKHGSYRISRINVHELSMCRSYARLQIRSFNEKSFVQIRTNAVKLDIHTIQNWHYLDVQNTVHNSISLSLYSLIIKDFRKRNPMLPVVQILPLQFHVVFGAKVARTASLVFCLANPFIAWLEEDVVVVEICQQLLCNTFNIMLYLMCICIPAKKHVYIYIYTYHK